MSERLELAIDCLDPGWTPRLRVIEQRVGQFSANLRCAELTFEWKPKPVVVRGIRKKRKTPTLGTARRANHNMVFTLDKVEVEWLLSALTESLERAAVCAGDEKRNQHTQLNFSFVTHQFAVTMALSGSAGLDLKDQVEAAAQKELVAIPRSLYNKQPPAYMESADDAAPSRKGPPPSLIRSPSLDRILREEDESVLTIMAARRRRKVSPSSPLSSPSSSRPTTPDLDL